MTVFHCLAKGKASDAQKDPTSDGNSMSDGRKVSKTDSSIGVIVGSAVAVIVCMIIVIIMVIIFLRK